MVTPAAIATAAALAAGSVLRATQEEALLEGPEYIRDAQPEGLTRRIGVGLARAACQRYGNNPSVVSGDRAVQFENACRPYLDSVDGGAGAGIAKPFEGGQCPGILYQADAEVFNIVTGQWGVFTTISNIRGPVISLDIQTISQFNQRWVVTYTAADGIGTQQQSTTNGVSRENARWGPLRRQDGLADDCGNPSPVVTEPQPPATPFPVPFPIIFAPGIDIDGNVEINPDGTINIDIGTGDITIDPFGSDSDGGSGGGGGPDDSPPSPEPGPELPGGNGGFGGDDEFGPPPVGRRWVGACITITNKPTNQPPIPGSEPEDVYAAVVGNIRLVYQASGTRQTDTPVRIQAKKVCVWEAVRKLNPTGVSVDLQPGFGYSYRPFSVPLDA